MQSIDWASLEKIPKVCVRKCYMYAEADIHNPQTHNKYRVEFKKKYIKGDTNNRRKTFNSLLEKLNNRMTNESVLIQFARIDDEILVDVNKLHLFSYKK